MSSRIFVRGLPPNITEVDFKKHFGEKNQMSQSDLPADGLANKVTDVRVFPHRRIGFVGYETAEVARNAVKYFNKTFIRMSRLNVELARPYEDARNSKTATAPVSDTHKNGTTSPSRGTSPRANSLKRKRQPVGAEKLDPQLQEYLDVVLPAKKTKETPGVVSQVEIPRAPVPVARDQSQGDDSDGGFDTMTPRQQHRGNGVARPETAEAVKDQPTESATDADWIKSRTQANPLLDDNDVNDEMESAAPTGEDPAEGVDKVLATKPTSDSEDVVAPQSEAEENYENEPTARLYVRNLPYTIDEKHLEEAFSSFGQLEEVHVPIDASTGKGKGFAFVQFTKAEPAEKALKALDGSIFQGRLLHILPALAKRESAMDEFAISKLPLKMQKLMRRKQTASSSKFNWNSLYMDADAVVSSMADRLGVDKADLLDPTSSDAAVKQAQAETHVIQETKTYFTKKGVDLEAFKSKQRGDTAILVKNFPYGTTPEELKTKFEEHGSLRRFLMPAHGTIAIVEFKSAGQAKLAYGALAYSRMGSKMLFLEKAPKDLFTAEAKATLSTTTISKAPTSELLQLNSSKPLDVPLNGPTATLFIRNLAFSTSTATLTSSFSHLTGFLSARVKTKPAPPKSSSQEPLSMGFGFVEFRTAADANAALSSMQDFFLDGHHLRLEHSQRTNENSVGGVNPAHDAGVARRALDNAERAERRTRKLVFKNVPFEATKRDIRELCAAYGQVRSVRLPRKAGSGGGGPGSRGFAFAEFSTPREAEAAMEALRNSHLLGRRLVIGWAEDEAEGEGDPEKEIERMMKRVGGEVGREEVARVVSRGQRRTKLRVPGGEADGDDGLLED